MAKLTFAVRGILSFTFQGIWMKAIDTYFIGGGNNVREYF
jgi:hypothetical protein